MKKVACAVLVVAATLSAVMAKSVVTTTIQGGAPVANPSITTTVQGGAPAPAPSSDAAGLVPLVGATILSFIAHYMHF